LGLVIAWLLGGGQAVAQDPGAAQIATPQSGQTLFGSVTIVGTARHPQFQRYKVEIASEETTTPDWFLVAEVTQQVTNGPLAQWNTSTIPDGRYQLRLRVILRDGTVLQASASGLVVTNQVPTALPTALPPPTEVPATPVPTFGPTPTPLIVQPPTTTPRPALSTPTDAPTVEAAPGSDGGDASAAQAAPPLIVAVDTLRNAFCMGAYCMLGVFGLVGAYSFVTSRLRALLRR
jgi:hypothetical protein